MKKIIISITIILMLLCIKTSHAQQPSLEQQLTNLNLNLFLNKPIDTLLAHIPYSDSIFVTSAEPIHRGAGLIIEYHQTPFLWLYITIYDPQYINPHSPDYLQPAVAWPINLVRKEKIGKVSIYKNVDTLINHATIE